MKISKEEAIKILSRYDNEYYTPATRQAHRMAVEALREQEEQRWVPVTDSPKSKGCYFVTVLHWLDGNPVTREAYWNGADWLSCDRRHELTPRVTHWMPLPEPPKGD